MNTTFEEIYEMLPIKDVGEVQDGNKWANAITADGSMWVWIPRYAYKITYTDSTDKSKGGTINQLLASTREFEII